MLASLRYEKMDNATPLPELNQLTKVRELDLLPPKRSRNDRKYCDVREREYLFEDEVDAMIKAARKVGRHGHRDSTLILIAFRHGLRVSELVNLKWSQVNFKTAHLHVNRVKGSRSSVHPIKGIELRSLRQLQRDYPDSPYLFVSERGGPMTPDAARKVIVRSGELAGLTFPVHPHQLRHSCGYYLASKGQDTRAIQDYLGHVNIHHTVKYTALSSTRFENFWDD
jgi:type 1 fimbriae regulatory protein FimB/type 1 fimbriae regulatory protein FimE